MKKFLLIPILILLIFVVVSCKPTEETKMDVESTTVIEENEINNEEKTNSKNKNDFANSKILKESNVKTYDKILHIYSEVLVLDDLEEQKAYMKNNPDIFENSLIKEDILNGTVNNNNNKLCFAFVNLDDNNVDELVIYRIGDTNKGEMSNIIYAIFTVDDKQIVTVCKSTTFDSEVEGDAKTYCCFNLSDNKNIIEIVMEKNQGDIEIKNVWHYTLSSKKWFTVDVNGTHVNTNYLNNKSFYHKIVEDDGAVFYIRIDYSEDLKSESIDISEEEYNNVCDNAQSCRINYNQTYQLSQYIAAVDNG